MSGTVLLISLNRCTMPDPVFPLGLGYLDGALRRTGYKVVWLDFLAKGEELASVLASTRPDFIGLSLRNIDDVLLRKQEVFYGELKEITSVVHEQCRCPVILGGSGFSIFPRELLELSGADYGICGDGEASLPALLETLRNGRGLEGVPGLVYRRDGAVVVNPVVPPGLAPNCAGAVERPVPVVDHYLRDNGMLNVQTQRGCSFRCCYCTYPLIEGRLSRRFSPEQVAEDFERIVRLGARYVSIVDSVFNSSAEHAAAVCEALLRRNVKLSWGCFLRPQGLTAELMRLMARAGLAHIEFGSDSFCDEVLAAYQKHFTFADILRSNQLTREAKVDCCHYLIAGGPGETIETLEQSFENSRRLQDAVILAVTGMRIYPRTALYERAVLEGVIGRETDLLTPAFYLAKGLTPETVQACLQTFAERATNWIVGDPGPGYQSVVRRLRQRGVVGPLWSYFSVMQRLWLGRPQTAPAS